ncbi:SDR family NAD(P)-dependent oxidoreductase [Mycobacteroides chelonae]|jgi:NAD(P)-dependent dehydrogenase (short-subunit alcohol dehydrogenase family)|uniref:SDR family NAD(P)-dependent oxidoreductase n=1 Tax=Mycobacteroides chelonae TaxID=1774 RepID=UPI0004AA9F1C|nr:SDR family NAD(P)-dependent oxidoreductase [Mycobacteroides chelonae]OHT73310.1 oxidoreductase [Mycobacteroides chelonae]OHT74693.1 oxidoreductase [Mycobacteroides chelonae]OHT89950.1 oxidoreductase [Mycobacteroides chelonae]OHU62854.1 oxidoreductase [Mycobacteroides chelonae]
MPVAVVTGAGSGIGRATAERFGRKGWTVVVSDINETTGAETVDRIVGDGGNAVFRRLDVADLADWELFTDWVCEHHGLPDLLVNNAGILIAGGFLEQTGADWRRMISINMMSPLVGSRLFVQRMVDAGARGHIANICSVGAFLPTSLAPSYVVAKQGAWFGTQALRAEFGRHGIGVSAICPGLIDTNLSANGTRSGVDNPTGTTWTNKLSRGQHFLGRSPDHVAAAIERGMRWNLSTVPVGLEAWLGWYLYRLSPGLSRGLMSLGRMSLAERVVDLGARTLNTLGIGADR